jgi:hypothetical protein
MNYNWTRIKFFISKNLDRILDFFEAISYNTRKTFHLIKNHDKTKAAGYHIKRASKSLILTNIESNLDWNDRLASSESFRIFDDDV